MALGDVEEGAAALRAALAMAQAENGHQDLT